MHHNHQIDATCITYIMKNCWWSCEDRCYVFINQALTRYPCLGFFNIIFVSQSWWPLKSFVSPSPSNNDRSTIWEWNVICPYLGSIWVTGRESLICHCVNFLYPLLHLFRCCFSVVFKSFCSKNPLLRLILYPNVCAILYISYPQAFIDKSILVSSLLFRPIPTANNRNI